MTQSDTTLMRPDAIADTEAVTEIVNPKISLEQRWLGIFACFTVVWGLLNMLSFTLGFYVTADSLSSHYSPAQISYMLETPVWAAMGKAFAACGLLIGSVYLLLRKASAYFWFMWSLFGILLVTLDSILRDGFHILGGMETGVNIINVIVGIFIFWAAYSAVQENQLEQT